MIALIPPITVATWPSACPVSTATLSTLLIIAPSAKLILGFILGVSIYILLTIFKIDFALPLAVFAAVMDLVPTIGPIWAGGLAVLWTPATAPEKFIWVGIGYLLIQLIVSNLIGLKTQGSQMKIHPAFIIILTVLGTYFAEILGFIMVLPLTMTISSIFE
jgi:predicted PurR-regulated permease PerM